MFPRAEFKLLIAVLVAALLACTASAAPGGQTLRAYFVGNSLTNQMDPASIGSMATSRGNTLVYGKHIDFGQALEQMWANPSGADETVGPFGAFPNALTNYQWDAISLQPFQRPIGEPVGDRIALRNFINLARTGSPNARFFLYSGWPFKYDGAPLMYDQRWLQPYSGQWDDTIRTRDFYAKLVGAVREDIPTIAPSILLVPTGEVLFELNRRMHAGEVPGYSDVGELYSDQLHLNETGRYLCALTFYATMFKQDPRGLPYDPGVIADPVVAAQLQDTAWQVVRTHPLAGLRPPIDQIGWPKFGEPPITPLPEPGGAVVVVVLVTVASLRRRVVR
jgi:hypothetical protein